MRGRRLWSSLYLQVLAGIGARIAPALSSLEHAAAMRPPGDGFIELVKMMIAPIVFTTVVAGNAQMGAMRDAGRIRVKALVYFEVACTVALAIGFAVVNVLQPGHRLLVQSRRASIYMTMATLVVAQALAACTCRFRRSSACQPSCS